MENRQQPEPLNYCSHYLVTVMKTSGHVVGANLGVALPGNLNSLPMRGPHGHRQFRLSPESGKFSTAATSAGASLPCVGKLRSHGIIERLSRNRPSTAENGARVSDSATSSGGAVSGTLPGSHLKPPQPATVISVKSVPHFAGATRVAALAQPAYFHAHQEFWSLPPMRRD